MKEADDEPTEIIFGPEFILQDKRPILQLEF